jgi:hypothetical protein
MLGSKRQKLLFDAGPEGDIFLRNCRNLGVTLADTQTFALSHRHCRLRHFDPEHEHFAMNAGAAQRMRRPRRLLFRN